MLLQVFRHLHPFSTPLLAPALPHTFLQLPLPPRPLPPPTAAQSSSSSSRFVIYIAPLHPRHLLFPHFSSRNLFLLLLPHHLTIPPPPFPSLSLPPFYLYATARSDPRLYSLTKTRICRGFRVLPASVNVIFLGKVELVWARPTLICIGDEVCVGGLCAITNRHTDKSVKREMYGGEGRETSTGSTRILRPRLEETSKALKMICIE